MSRADQRRAEQDAYTRDIERSINERPSNPPVPQQVTDRRSWASDCAGWRVGTHERTKENRLAGIYKCKWCGQTFDPPNADDLKIIRARNLGYQRHQHVSRGKW